MNELLVFAKAPRLGFVKTRLAQTLGRVQALRAYEQLLGAVALRLAGIENVTVCYSPAGAEGELRPYFPARWRFRAQEGLDLGERLRNALGAAFAAGCERVVVVGTDCPYLNAEDIESAWRLLAERDLVLGPANDGGYWLLGARQLHSPLFTAIDWGTGAVLEQTLERARDLGLSVARLRPLSDVDTESDWQAFLEGERLKGGL